MAHGTALTRFVNKITTTTTELLYSIKIELQSFIIWLPLQFIMVIGLSYIDILLIFPGTKFVIMGD